MQLLACKQNTRNATRSDDAAYTSSASNKRHTFHTTSTIIKHHIYYKTHRNREHRAVVVVAPPDHLDGTLAELDGRSEERHRADGRRRDQGRGVLSSGLARSEEE